VAVHVKACASERSHEIVVLCEIA